MQPADVRTIKSSFFTTIGLGFFFLASNFVLEPEISVAKSPDREVRDVCDVFSKQSERVARKDTQKSCTNMDCRKLKRLIQNGGDLGRIVELAASKDIDEEIVIEALIYMASVAKKIREPERVSQILQGMAATVVNNVWRKSNKILDEEVELLADILYHARPTSYTGDDLTQCIRKNAVIDSKGNIFGFNSGLLNCYWFGPALTAIWYLDLNYEYATGHSSLILPDDKRAMRILEILTKTADPDTEQSPLIRHAVCLRLKRLDPDKKLQSAKGFLWEICANSVHGKAIDIDSYGSYVLGVGDWLEWTLVPPP